MRLSFRSKIETLRFSERQGRVTAEQVLASYILYDFTIVVSSVPYLPYKLLIEAQGSHDEGRATRPRCQGGLQFSTHWLPQERVPHEERHASAGLDGP